MNQILKIVILIVIINTVVQADFYEMLKKEWRHLSTQQKAIAYKTFYTAKKFNMQYTMTAIAWRESNFGKWSINLRDPSCGVFHVMPRYIADGKWKQSRICERLIFDYDFSFSQAIAKLKLFENYWKTKGVSKVWSHTVVSYNQGYSWNQNSQYLKEIRERIRFLKTVIK